MSTTMMSPSEKSELSVNPDASSNTINKPVASNDEEPEALLFMAKLAEQTSRIEGISNSSCKLTIRV